MNTGRIWLSVPYREKEEAKKLGARWDPTVRRWWIRPSELAPIQARNSEWLANGDYSIAITGKLYLVVGIHMCPRCAQRSRVAGTIATEAYELDSELGAQRESDDVADSASQDPVFICQLRAISDHQLKARIDEHCPFFWPNRHGVYRNHCEGCGYEFHEGSDLFGDDCPFIPAEEPGHREQPTAIDLCIGSPTHVNASMRWIWSDQCDLLAPLIAPRMEQAPVAVLAQEDLEEATAANGQGTGTRDVAGPAALSTFWRRLWRVIALAWRSFAWLVHVIMWIPVSIVRWRRRRAWDAWNDALELQRIAGAKLIRVRRVRQLARTGTKGYAEWLGTGDRRAIWVPEVHVSKGQYLVVQGSVGHGDHHGETVFFVNELLRVLPAGTHTKWRRYEAFLSKRDDSIERNAG